MKKLFAIVLILFLFGFGCTGSGSGKPTHSTLSTTDTLNETSGAEPELNETPYVEPEEEEDISCQEYCESADSQSCTWEALGTYPDCMCYLECPPPEEESGQNESTQEYVDVDFSDALDDAIDQAKSDFYNSIPGGTFTVQTFKWAKLPSDESDSTSITVASLDVEFNGQSFDSIQSSGYSMFYDEEDHLYAIYGVSIFNSTEFDSSGMQTGFDVAYVPATTVRTLIDCSIYNKEYLSNLAVAYYYECKDKD